jgi:hypothetical protein
MKDTLSQVRSRIAKGYKGELLYNFRSGFYEVTTWNPSDNSDLKMVKIPRGQYDPAELKEVIYGCKYTK